jgi:glycosyltransferase involved in cell wall biosynthesis
MRKILISAYACEPNKGSEQGVGWSWVLEMAKTDELWVITRSNNQDAIERCIPKEYCEKIHFIYYDLPLAFRRLKKKDRGIYFYYTCWQWGSYLLAKRMYAHVSFDYCLHLTFGSMWQPTFLAWLPIPFIWGPIGGGEAVPFTSISALSWRGRLIQYARYVLIRTAMWNPFFVYAVRKAVAIIARTKESKDVFPARYHDKIDIMLETGISVAQLEQYTPARLRSGGAIKLVYTGRLIDTKNVSLALAAMAEVLKRRSDVIFTIVGDGPLKFSLIALAEHLGISKNVNFVGVISHSEVIDYLQESDIFVFPSLKEGGTWSLIEAMAVGLPVVCIDNAGMHIITDEQCAIRIKPSAATSMRQQMADAIIHLIDTPEQRMQMGASGRQRLQSTLLWQYKGEFMQRLFERLDRKMPAAHN